MASKLQRPPQALDAILTGDLPGVGEIWNHLEVLESYECWVPYLRRCQKLRERYPAEAFLLLQKECRAYLVFLEDVGSATQACKAAIEELKLDYSTFFNRFLEPVLLPNSYGIETKILTELISVFRDSNDLVLCQERLCLIYEKKKFDADLLWQAYQKLLQLDPFNVKALKYFKSIAFQERDFPAVADILRKLLQGSSHPADQDRLGMELASTLLYQLSDPEGAVSVIKQLPNQGYLDIRPIKYDACFKLHDWGSCLDILHEQLKGESEAKAKAVLYYRIGQVCREKQVLKESAEAFEKSIELDEGLLLAYEARIEIASELEEWDIAGLYLQRLEPKLSPAFRGPIHGLLQRLQIALERASA